MLLSRHNDPVYRFIKLFSNLTTLLVGDFFCGGQGRTLQVNVLLGFFKLFLIECMIYMM